ncbi:MAG: histidine kinase [Rikenellaceae bacterium]|nr:histidine kinase [Rikenellaceae bacterium]
MISKYAIRFPMTFIHILVWLIVFCIPFFSWTNDDDAFTWNRYLFFCVKTLLLMLVFYSIFFFLVDRFVFGKKIWAFVLINIFLLSVATVYLYQWYRRDFLRGKPDHFSQTIDRSKRLPDTSGRSGPPSGKPPHLGRREPHIGFFMIREGMMLILIAGLALVIRMTMQWSNIEREKRALETAHTEAELKNLKNQLNPHFLFNTLNNIYSLIEFNPEQARYAMESLSKMLRHVLYDSSQRLVAIEQEFTFMKSYIELMALRLPADARLEVHIPENGHGILIAPLLFINSVENAFKHGISRKNSTFIRISIRLIGNKEVECLVENSYFPRSNEEMGSGIGLENLKRRMDLLYPDRYEMVHEQRENTYFFRLHIRL